MSIEIEVKFSPEDTLETRITKLKRYLEDFDDYVETECDGDEGVMDCSLRIRGKSIDYPPHRFKDNPDYPEYYDCLDSEINYDSLVIDGTYIVFEEESFTQFDRFPIMDLEYIGLFVY